MSLLNLMKFFGFSTPEARSLVVPAGTGVDAPASEYEVTVLRDVMVSMRDGVRLAMDIYLPARDGKAIGQPFPVILERTPYGKNIRSRTELTSDNPVRMTREEVAGFFVHRGYVVIYQDCRGRHKSEGEFVKYTSEGNDGYDTCAWIVAQS
jgi:putative CocE/NonD family hydrolase